MTGSVVRDPVRVEADYLIETAYDPRQAAEAMAGEQSSGTFVPVPGETPELKARAAARVEVLDLLEAADTPALPGAGMPRNRPEARPRRARITLSWPIDNMGPSLPNLMATVAGNLFELKQFSGLRLLDIRLPSAFAAAYGGPKFGIPGTRRLAGVETGPLIGTIIKPSVGMGPEDTASMVEMLCAAGIDFIKDDELQADGPHCPFDDRVRLAMRAINRAADRTGKKAMYAFNLTGELDQMLRRHDLVRELGGTCIMASINSVGMTGMVALARHTELPLHAHRNGWGYLSRHPLLGWSYAAWAKLWRLAGVDHMHVNGLANKFSESDESVIEAARSCLTPMFAETPCLVMPVFSSGQTVAQVPGTYRALGSGDLIHAAGGGIMAHPDGPAAGVASFRAAWAATLAGETLEARAAGDESLAKALKAVAS